MPPTSGQQQEGGRDFGGLLRILSALVLLPPLVAILLYAPAWAFLLLVEAVALLAALEFFHLFRERNRLFRTIGFAATALLVASFYPGMLGASSVFLLLLLALGVAALHRGVTAPSTPADVALTFIGCAYTGLLLGSAVGVRLTPPDPAGRSWVILLLAIVFLGDTGAYYAGKAFGRRPLAPSISPKKTLAGLYGGVGVSVAVALGGGRFLFPELPLLHVGLLGLGLSLLSVMGDLFESLLKRSVGVKDAGALLPGHGGFLDRLDGLLFSSPALYLYLHWSAQG